VNANFKDWNLYLSIFAARAKFYCSFKLHLKIFVEPGDTSHPGIPYCLRPVTRAIVCEKCVWCSWVYHKLSGFASLFESVLHFPDIRYRYTDILTSVQPEDWKADSRCHIKRTVNSDSRLLLRPDLTIPYIQALIGFGFVQQPAELA
jgi:hypothetical protein